MSEQKNQLISKNVYKTCMVHARCRHIHHYCRLAIKWACISDVPIIPSKLLQISDRSLASRSSFEGIIGTDIHACFMASLLVMLEVGASLIFFSNQTLQRKGRGNRHGYGWLWGHYRKHSTLYYSISTTTTILHNQLD